MNFEELCKNEFQEAFNKCKYLRNVEAKENFIKEYQYIRNNELLKIRSDDFENYKFLIEESEKNAYIALNN